MSRVPQNDILFPRNVNKFLTELEVEVKESLKTIKESMRKYLINFELIKSELSKNVFYFLILVLDK